MSLDHIGMGQNHVPLVNIPNKNMARFMDAHSPQNGVYRYWSMAIYDHIMYSNPQKESKR